MCPYDPGVTTTRFTIALSDMGEALVLPGLAARVQALAPNAMIQIVERPLAAIEQGLERGDIHLAIGYRPDLRRTTYFHQKLFSSNYACIMPRSHAVRGGRLDVTQFLALKHIIVRADNRAQEDLEQYFARQRMKRHVFIETPHILTVPSLVARSHLVATLPLLLARQMEAMYPDIKMVVPEFRLPSVDVKQYWHRRFHKDPVNKWLRNLIAQTYQSSES